MVESATFFILDSLEEVESGLELTEDQPDRDTGLRPVPAIVDLD